MSQADRSSFSSDNAAENGEEKLKFSLQFINLLRKKKLRKEKKNSSLKREQKDPTDKGKWLEKQLVKPSISGQRNKKQLFHLPGIKMTNKSSKQSDCN